MIEITGDTLPKDIEDLNEAWSNAVIVHVHAGTQIDMAKLSEIRSQLEDSNLDLTEEEKSKIVIVTGDLHISDLNCNYLDSGLPRELGLTFIEELNMPKEIDFRQPNYHDRQKELRFLNKRGKRR